MEWVFGSESVPQTSWKVLLIHVIPLFIGYGICTPVSVLIARHYRGWFRKRNYDWYQWHLNLQLISHVFTAIGIIIPFIFFVDLDDFYHFRHLHGILGIILAVGMLVIQPVLGTIDERYPEEDERIKLQRHSMIGRVLFLGSFVIMYLGILLLRPPNTIFYSPIAYEWFSLFETFFIIWAFVLYFFFLFKEYRKQKRIRNIKSRIPKGLKQK